jgi:hypothetical protein
MLRITSYKLFDVGTVHVIVAFKPIEAYKILRTKKWRGAMLEYKAGDMIYEMKRGTR